MGKPIKHGATSVLLELDLGVTGLASVGSPPDFAPGLIISAKCDLEENATVYEADNSDIETITTIGTYQAPSAGKVRFAETDTPGTYALYLENERFAVDDGGSPVLDARTLLINVRIAEGSPPNPQFGLPETGLSYEIDLVKYDPYDEPITLTALADAALLRDWESITDTVPARCLLNAVRFLRNKWSLSGSTLTVYEEDGTTVAFTMTVNSDSGAEPIIGSTPD